jgi:hypothetical protein
MTTGRDDNGRDVQRAALDIYFGRPIRCERCERLMQQGARFISKNRVVNDWVCWPCRAITRIDYRTQAEGFIDFLKGKTDEPPPKYRKP